MSNAPSDDSIFSSSPGSSSQESSADNADDSLIFSKQSYTGPGFESDALRGWLNDASASALHRAPFGIIEVDDDGKILFYNATESQFAGIPREDAEGKNFFSDIAPCTESMPFRGRFEKMIRGEDDETYDVVFSYTFTYRMSPTLVDIRMLRSAGRSWILVRPEGSVFKGIETASDALSSQ
jgi:photoactive yellow protein